jgi:hypothetical protein
MAAQPHVTNFARPVEALDPWLDWVFIIGGGAGRLYWANPPAQPLEYRPAGTLDNDAVAPRQLRAIGQEIQDSLFEKRDHTDKAIPVPFGRLLQGQTNWYFDPGARSPFDYRRALVSGGRAVPTRDVIRQSLRQLYPSRSRDRQFKSCFSTMGSLVRRREGPNVGMVNALRAGEVI